MWGRTKKKKTVSSDVFLDQLPVELILYMGQFLTKESVLSWAKTSKFFNGVLKDKPFHETVFPNIANEVCQDIFASVRGQIVTFMEESPITYPSSKKAFHFSGIFDGLSVGNFTPEFFPPFKALAPHCQIKQPKIKERRSQYYLSYEKTHHTLHCINHIISNDHLSRLIRFIAILKLVEDFPQIEENLKEKITIVSAALSKQMEAETLQMMQKTLDQLIKNSHAEHYKHCGYADEKANEYWKNIFTDKAFIKDKEKKYCSIM